MSSVNLRMRLKAIEARLCPPAPMSFVFLHGRDEAPLEAYRLEHGGKDPDKVIRFITVEPDGHGGAREICD